jgi:hypothetical protein
MKLGDQLEPDHLVEAAYQYILIMSTADHLMIDPFPLPGLSLEIVPIEKWPRFKVDSRPAMQSRGKNRRGASPIRGTVTPSRLSIPKRSPGGGIQNP